MKTIIIKRSYGLAIFAIFHFLLFAITKFIIYKNIIEIDNSLAVVVDSREAFDNVYRLKDSLETNFGILYALSALVIAYILYLEIKNSRGNIRVNALGLLIFLFCYVFYAFGQNSSIELHPDTRGYSSFEFYSYYVIFIPYLYLIYKYSIVGIKEDITIEVKNKKDEKHIDSLEDLDKLLKLNLLTNQEHQQKKELQKKNKIREDIKETEEYNLLIKSKAIGLINEDEFNMKIKGLIDKIYKENEK
jgi:hypothetical protein